MKQLVQHKHLDGEEISFFHGSMIFTQSQGPVLFACPEKTDNSSNAS
jgi:hypothetical protein